MVDLFAQVVAIFDTPAGMTVLGMAALAFAALFVVVFWDSIKAPRRDVIQGRAQETAPPPLLAPDMITRGGDAEPVSGRANVSKMGVLFGLGALFMFAGVAAVGQIGDQASIRATERASLAPAQPANIQGAPAREEIQGTPDQVDVCEGAGSLEERFVEVCANGASVRFDLLRFSQDETFVLRPTWASNKAPRFVKSDSHAAPFSFDGDVSFAAPEVVSNVQYDGYLVIGIAEGDEGVAVERERALRDFAVTQLSGGDRAQCSTSERVFSVSALFDRAPIEELAALDRQVSTMQRAASRDHQVRGELAAMEQELADRRLTVVDHAAPLVLGITADPNASNRVEDMRLASQEFVSTHAAALQIKDVTNVTNLRACARGASAL